MRPSATDHVPAFGPLLFGRARAKVPAQALHPESIADLHQSFGRLIPEARWSSQTPAPPSRERVFTALITFWAFLSQVLSVDAACRSAVRKVQAGWTLQGKGPLSANSSAYCQARTRLRNDTLEAIQQQLARGLEGNVSSEQLGLGRRVKVVDGTACSMPDTAQNQALYPQREQPETRLRLPHATAGGHRFAHAPPSAPAGQFPARQAPGQRRSAGHLD